MWFRRVLFRSVPGQRRRRRWKNDFQFAVVGAKVLTGAFNGLFSFRAVLRINDDFPDAFGDRYQAIAADAARAPNLEIPAVELGHGKGFLDPFGMANHVALSEATSHGKEGCSQ